MLELESANRPFTQARRTRRLDLDATPGPAARHADCERGRGPADGRQAPGIVPTLRCRPPGTAGVWMDARTRAAVLDSARAGLAVHQDKIRLQVH
eukprot:scaffold674_cov371-Prasinococcus_capsulatus_cf.AAC.16